MESEEEGIVCHCSSREGNLMMIVLLETTGQLNTQGSPWSLREVIVTMECPWLVGQVGQTSLGVTFGGNLNMLLPWWAEGLWFFLPMQ